MLAVDGAEVGANYDEVDVCEVLACLELDDDEISDEQIQTVHADLGTAVQDRHGELSGKGDVPPPQLDCERIFVDRLEEAWAESPMDLDGGADDLAAELVQIHSRILETLLILCTYSGGWSVNCERQRRIHHPLRFAAFDQPTLFELRPTGAQRARRTAAE